MSPSIFTEDRIAQVREEYGDIPESEHPDVYYLACEECGRPIREKIEGWANDLPRDIISETAPLLFDPERFRSTYGELVTMYHLARLGFEFDYEKELPNGKTPDLSVYESSRGPAFICEVYTEGVSAEMSERLQPVDKLRRALSEISLDCALALRRSRSGHDPQAFDARAAAREAECWLRQGHSIGDMRTLGPFEAKVIGLDEGYDHVEVAGPWTIHWVDDGRPWGKLKDKLAKYRRTANELARPLVLAYVTDFVMATTPRTVANVLFGQEGVRVHTDKRTGEFAGTEPFRDDDGMFSNGNPALSAVLVVKEIDGNITTTAFHNPHADNPLPSDIFVPS